MHAKITKLGRALGVTLYERVGRRLVLIPAGHRLAALARDTSARVGEYLAERDAANAPITLAAAAVAPLAWAIVDFEDIEHLRRHSPAWRLLRADNAPLVLSFLGRVFVEDNARSLPLGRLIELLDDELFALNGRLGEGTFPKAAKSYLDDWAAPTSGWLRVYYPAGSDEAHVDATPAVEKALAWVESARTRSFVGTESRLQTAFELLRQMAYGTEPDDAVRLEELARRRAEIDREIARVEAGEQPPLDTTALRDRYQQFSDTARGLLADFREVEANLRRLDRSVREQIAGWDGTKGELLASIVGDRHAITDSDQGRSFHAFYDFLLSSERQTEFAELLARVHAQADLGDDVADPRLRTIHYDWLDAGEQVQQTVRQLSEQLRRFLDDQVWLENRRVTELLRRVEAAALRLRDHPGVRPVIELDDTSPTVNLPMERPLYRPLDRRGLASVPIELGDAADLDLSGLVEQVYVDRVRLARGVRSLVARHGQVGLVDVLVAQPLEQGLAELVAYLALDEPGILVDMDESVRDRIPIPQDDGTARVAVLPRVTFVRSGQDESGGDESGGDESGRDESGRDERGAGERVTAGPVQAPSDEPHLSIAVTRLMQGVVYRDGSGQVWASVAALQTAVRDYVRVLGLELVLDEAEGYAFLRSRPDDADEVALPRLVARHRLSLHVSVLLALLRKKLAEFDASDGGTKLVLSREQIVDLVRVFMPEQTTEKRLIDQIDTHIGKVVDLGYLRRLPGQTGMFEVRRILKAFVDAQWLADLAELLEQYASELTGEKKADRQPDPAEEGAES